MGRKLLCALGLLLAGAGPVAGTDVEARIEASRKVVREFVRELRAELMKALEAGGPAGAIDVCSRRAPEIAARLSRETGWNVGRTSLRYRNPDSAPDEWERRVLERFEARRASGGDIRSLEYAQVVEEGGRQVFRYMKAIPTRRPCLACHGENLDPEVAARIRERYPDDRATGFRVGGIRGAFTIVQPMGRSSR